MSAGYQPKPGPVSANPPPRNPAGLESEYPKTPNRVKCTKCLHSWVGFYTPMEMFKCARLIKSLRCPMCAATAKDIVCTFKETP